MPPSPSTSVGQYASAVLPLVLAVLLTGCSGAPDDARDGDGGAEPPVDLTEAVEELEDEYDARVGVSLIDVEEGDSLNHRGDERFGFASTVKAYAAAALIEATSTEEREEHLWWTQEDVDAAGYSPVTEQAVDTGLTLGELAEAAVRESDNTATNLVLEHLGGPEGLQEALEAAGDPVTRPVDIEPDLNDVAPGEEANTSTADALAGNLERITTGRWLDGADQDLFMGWMSGNATGDTLIRAGAPDGWEVAEKSGGAGAIRNDVAVLLPPQGGPIVLVVLTERNDPDEEYDDALVADVARTVLAEIS